jgi:hypothetical protein
MGRPNYVSGRRVVRQLKFLQAIGLKRYQFWAINNMQSHIENKTPRLVVVLRVNDWSLRLELAIMLKNLLIKSNSIVDSTM